MNSIEILELSIQRLQELKDEVRCHEQEYGIDMAIDEIRNMIDELLYVKVEEFQRNLNSETIIETD